MRAEVTGRSVGSDASPLSCFLFRPRKSCEKRRKRSHTNVPNTLITRTSTPPAQTAHVRFHRRKRVHTRLHSKDRTQRLTRRNKSAFLPRPQHGLELPMKFLLFCHAFIYIHFLVLCEPQLSADEKKPANLPHKFYPPTASHCVFQLRSQMAHVCFHRRKWIHTCLRQQDRTQRLTRRNTGRFGWGRYHYPRSVPHVSETLRGQGVERQTLPLLGLGQGGS